MTEFLFTAKAQRAQRKYSMKLAATRALSSLRPLRLCGELKCAVYARVQYIRRMLSWDNEMITYCNQDDTMIDSPNMNVLWKHRFVSME
jgi:hypothetical protein